MTAEQLKAQETKLSDFFNQLHAKVYPYITVYSLLKLVKTNPHIFKHCHIVFFFSVIAHAKLLEYFFCCVSQLLMHQVLLCFFPLQNITLPSNGCRGIKNLLESSHMHELIKVHILTIIHLLSDMCMGINGRHLSSSFSEASERPQGKLPIFRFVKSCIFYLFFYTT